MDSRNGRFVARDGGGNGYGGGGYNKKPCFAYQRGECKFGSSCRYSHDGNSSNGGRSQYGGRGNYQDRNRGGRGDGALSTDRPRPNTGRGRGGWAGKKPESMIDRPGHVAIPEAVNMVNVLVVGIGNFTEDDTYDNLSSSVQEVAELLVEQGDLQTYADDISDIFVKCFSQLTMQTPVIATLLSLISKSDRAFPSLVLSKLSSKLSESLQSGDVVVARNHLRALSCLASAGCVSVDGEGAGIGLAQILGALCDAAEAHSPSASKLSVGAEAAIYLLASCVPYVFTALQASAGSTGAELASRITALCRYVTNEDESGNRRISPYDTNGGQPVFHVSIDGTAAPPCVGDSTTGHTAQESSPSGAVCWDSLWEICKVADNILTSIEATGGASVAPENIPKCLLLLWLHPDLQEPLQKEVAQPAPPPAAAAGEDDSEAVEAAAEATPHLPPRITLDAIDASAIGSTLLSNPFAVLAGHVVDYYAGPTHTTGSSKTERAKSGNNAASGYGSWMSVRFNVFDEDISGDCVKALTSLTLLELVTARDYFRSVLRFFEPFIRDDGTRVGSVEMLCSHLLSVFQFFPADAHLEYVLLDTLLMMIVQVPALNLSLVERVVLELCVQSPLVPAVLAVVSCALYEFIPAMNVVSWRQLSRFLSGHLANTHLQWPYWSYWGEEYAATVATQDFAANGNSQKVFVDLLISECTRLSLPERMKAVLDEDLASTVPADESVFSPQTSHYSISSDGICSGVGSLAKAADDLMRMLFKREEPQVLLQWLEVAHEGVDDSFEESGWRITLFVEALLCRGTATGGTLWGMIGLIDRYHPALLELSVSSDSAYMTIAHALFSCLHSQCALLHTVLDILMRRGVLAPDAVAAYMTQNDVPVPGNLHISNVHTNHWVWRMVEVAMDRSLDIAKASMAMQNSSAYSQREAMDDGADRGDVVIADEILEAVESAAERCREFYQAIVSPLLRTVHRRHEALVESGEETAGSKESGAITSLDPCLVVNISMLNATLRNFHMNEVGLKNSCADGTRFPAVTCRLEVARVIVDASGEGGSVDNAQAALRVLTGPAHKVWSTYCEMAEE